MTRWCIECAQQQQHQAATKTVDGDPLCDFHAKKAGESSSEQNHLQPRASAWGFSFHASEQFDESDV